MLREESVDVTFSEAVKKWYAKLTVYLSEMSVCAIATCHPFPTCNTFIQQHTTLPYMPILLR